VESGRTTADRRSRARRLAEAGAWLGAVALAVLVVARIASTPRAALLFTDGDSMLPILVMRSLGVGQAQDWAMSSVLFLPELLVFGGIWLLGFGGSGDADAAVVANAVVNLVALYGALRVASGARRTTAAPVAGALVAFVVFATLAALDHTGSRDSLELASLMSTTTYYSATVIAVVVSLGLVRRLADGSSRPRTLLVLLGAVAGVSVLSNPLFLLWATAPLGLLLFVVLAARRRPVVLLWSVVAIAAGSILGMLGRIPLAPFIANDGLGYIDLRRAGASAAYYGRLVADLCTSPLGAASFVLVLVVLAAAVASSILLRRTERLGAFLLATAGWVLPLVVVVAAILLGTNAARYVQPAVFAPVAALAVAPDVGRALGVRRPSRGAVLAVAAGGGAVVIVAAAVVGIPRLVSAAGRTDADLACVTTWVDASGRIGGGQYWTVRLPKAHVADPRSLVQVDATLRPYDWLVNRRDADAGAVSFLVIDAQSPPFLLPGGVTMADAQLVSCGRYTIADFGGTELPLGIPRS
jgi:hypothetical protein